MNSQLNRRTFVLTGAAAAAALSGSHAAFAQDGDKPTLRVGSKNFTEHFVMSEIVALMLEDAGYPVERKFGLGGTAIIAEAIMNNDIDMYVEYTGTAYMAILGLELPEAGGEGATATPAQGATATPAGASVEQQIYDIVKQRYDEELNLTWLEDWGFNNTYAMCVTQETAEEYGLQTTSDLEPIAGDMKLGTDLEWPLRPDGLPGFVDAYGFTFGDVQSGDPGLMYQALDNGDVDVITAYTTDGRIEALDLVILEDDKNFFPPYYTAPVIRNEVLEANPEIADILNVLGGQFTEEDMQSLNYEVDVNGLNPADAARPVLEEKGLLDSN